MRIPNPDRVCHWSGLKRGAVHAANPVFYDGQEGVFFCLSIRAKNALGLNLRKVNGR